MTNTYVLGNARWTKILARNRNVAPGNAINFNGRGVPSFIGAGDGAVPLGTKNRIHIVNGAEAFTLQKEMGATVQVMNARPPIASGKYIVKTSWYRGAKGVDFEKWARQCRKEAYIQSELSTQYARCGIFPRVAIHGFVRGAFHVVSECPPNIRLVDIERISTVAEARATYNAVAAAIYLMWTSKVAPMRYAPHMFALAGARSPHAVVLDYNQIVIFDEVVDKAFRPYLQRLKTVEGSCGRLKTKPGTLESIWFGLRSVTRRMMSKHISLYKSYKEPGERTTYTSVMNFLARLGETMNDPPAAGRPVSRGGRGRRTLFGRGLRLLGGRRGSRSDPDKKSPPLKIRKVATLPESEGGWRPRKHSATWGVTRTAESNHNNHNNARHGNRTSQFRAPNAIYTSPKSTPSNTGNENGIASAPPAQSTPMFPASSAPPNPFVNNKEEYNDPYNLRGVKNTWSGLNQKRKNFIVESELNKSKDEIDRLKKIPEVSEMLRLKAQKVESMYNKSSPAAQSQSRDNEMTKIISNAVTKAFRGENSYVNNASRNARILMELHKEFKVTWPNIDKNVKDGIVQKYITRFQNLDLYKQLIASNKLNTLVRTVYAHNTSRYNIGNRPGNAHKKYLDHRLRIYIADYLHKGCIFGVMDDNKVISYIDQQFKNDVQQVKNVAAFASSDATRAIKLGYRQALGFLERYVFGPSMQTGNGNTNK
jgi:hypothetical protein